MSKLPNGAGFVLLNIFKLYCYIRCILYVSPKRDSVVVVIVCRIIVVFTITYAVISGYLH
jgi:hypothetical protein